MRLKKSNNSDLHNTEPLDDDEIISSLKAVETALDLRRIIEYVALEEFHRQEDRYERDCSQGRELLFLIANHEWVRGTSEIVTIARSDTIDTEIKIDIDLRRITHEAFREKIGQVWLPVTVLPLLAAQRRLEPDPFATVTDAAGNLLPLMPADDLGNQISAALAEIIVNMAIAHVRDMLGASANDILDGGQAVSPRVAARDQRVLLATAIAHLLRRDSGQHDATVASASPTGENRKLEESFKEFQAKAKVVRDDIESASSKVRITRARNLLLRLVDVYIECLGRRAGIIETPKGEEYQFVPELAYRAVRVLQALADSTIIVVPVNFDIAPTVFTARVPARNLIPTATPFTWRRPIRLLNFRQWLIRPSGHLDIGVLLPTADAARQIQIRLADGMSFEEPSISKGGSAQTVLPCLDIKVREPAPLKDWHAADAADEADKAKKRAWPSNRAKPLAELAQSKKAAADDLDRHYKVGPGPDRASTPAGGDAEDPKPLSDLPAGSRLFRRTSVDPPGRRTLVARAEMIEDVTQHATPEEAIVRADIRVDDRDYFSAPRTFAIMSVIVMAIILASIVGWHYLTRRTSLTAEVAAIVLTLFVTIQASQMHRPDRTTLKGLLSSPGTLLIAPSMLPSLTLAVALSFNPGVLGGSLWAAGCIVGQVLFLAFMWRGPLTTIKASSNQSRSWLRLGARRNLGTERLDYSHFEALRSDYWRNTTAEALMLGRMAYGYVVWQGTDQPCGKAGSLPPQLEPILTGNLGRANAVGKPPEPNEPIKPVSVLALLHSSTQRQAITFVVFRDKLEGKLMGSDSNEEHWPTPNEPIIRRLDLDPDRLAPTDNVTSKVDVFIGLHGDFPSLSSHPLITVLKAARKRLIVLEAQLPFPAPLSGYQDKQWARVRVALRDSGDIHRLAEFLGEVYKEFGKSTCSAHALAVQTDPIVPPAVIFEGWKPSSANNEDTAAAEAGDLYVPAMKERSDVPTWRMVTTCAEARSNIESDILDQLPTDVSNFQLMHLNFALLHGIAVIIVLLHDRGIRCGSDASFDYVHGRERSAESLDAAPFRRGASDFGTVVNGKVSAEMLGPMISSRLVRIRFRWQDRPGGFLNVLNSINSAFKLDPPAIHLQDRSVSYARIQVATGRIAEGDLTVRLHSPADDRVVWTPTLTERMARNISADAARDAIRRDTPRLGTADYLDRPENPVIRIDLLGGDLLWRTPRHRTGNHLADQVKTRDE
jgi:hypothetical protein